ncbi:MAG: fructosamine kinase family protein [Methylococcales bacterium]|nr:fructosamine kinase family protein [Methylococcales bacterium]
MENTYSWQQIAKQIEQATQQSFTITNISPVSGGCINSAYILYSKKTSYFIKLNQANCLPMFEAEFSGLKEIIQTKTIKTPLPIICGVSEDKSFIVMENISFSFAKSLSDKKLGEQLAGLHQIPQPFFGWHVENTIGSTAQLNHSSEKWVSFWKKYRLGFQLSLAEKNGYGGKLSQSGRKLCESLDYFFSQYTPSPSLLHGDLWSGNAAVTTNGEPIIYDPACYYGDREADIAMTELFGGFGSNFYSAYTNTYPLDSDYPIRKNLYNLYHILNHLNLFGEGYRRQAQSLIDSLLSEIK